jgi:hypothetical protein
VPLSAISGNIVGVGDTGTDHEYPTHVVIGYLSGGRIRAVGASVVALYASGHVVSGRPGTVRKSDTAQALPAAGFDRVVWSDLRGSLPTNALAVRPSVDRALNELRAALRLGGYLRRGVPLRLGPLARTARARQALAAAAADRRALPAQGRTFSPEQAAVAVAVSGLPALQALFPQFARESRLLDRSADEGLAEGGNSMSGGGTNCVM